MCMCMCMCVCLRIVGAPRYCTVRMPMHSANSLRFAILLVLIIQFVYGQTPAPAWQCPNSCTSHGNCVRYPDGHIACLCNAGYAGNDCSIPVRALSSGETITDRVDAYNWKFYTISVPGGTHTLLFQVWTLESTAHGDCDLFIKKGDYPTRDRYDYKDDSLAKNFSILINPAAPGTWWAGMYGFTACDFRMQVTVTGSCAENCNGNGDCVNGACRCYSGWIGPTCATPEEELPLNVVKVGSVATGKWRYYHIALPDPTPQLVILMNQTTTHGDCDLYVRREALPDFFNWDYVNTTTQPKSSIVITNAARGYWFLGIYGFDACSYNLLAFRGYSCPNECSRHGRCAGSTCTCDSDYSGVYCETKLSPLQLDERVSGFVEFNSWNYYRFQTNTARTLAIGLYQEDSHGDCDIFVRKDSKPDRFHFDYADERIGQNITLTIADPLVGEYWIGIYGAARCGYSLQITETVECGVRCVHGRCVNHLCHCDRGWAGQACDLPVTPLVQNTALTGAVAVNEWHYYSFTSDSSTIYIHLREKNSTGFLWLFASDTYPPTLTQHDAADQRMSSVHTVSFEYSDNDRSPTTIIIGVYGSPYQASQPHPSAYDIVAWGTPF